MDTISFARGVPSADLLPVDDLRAAAAGALQDNPAGALSYSPGGYRPLREWIGERHGVPAERVLMLNGSLQGVVFMAQHLFHESGGRLVVEDPTYDRTLIAMRTFGAEITGVTLTPEGIDVDALERVLGDGPAPKLLYVIPAFQNPSGLTLSLERRHRLLDLCRERGVLVLEDDPYGLLRFEGEALPTLHELDGGDNVIHSSSFTKTVAPGIRTGYLVLPERLAGPLARISENTVIGPNTLAEATLDAYCRAGRFEPNVERATAALKERRDAMEAALREHFPDDARWTTPGGGYFYWVDLPEQFDTAALLGAASERGVPFVKGADFCIGGGGRSSLRLAFSAVKPEQIGEGIARLGALLAEQRQPAAV